MNQSESTWRASIELKMDPGAAFDTVMGELTGALALSGISFEPRENARVVEGTAEVGRVLMWKPGERIVLEWREAPWQPDDATEIQIGAVPMEGGARVTLEQRGWGRELGGGAELAGWFAREVAAPLLRAVSPQAFGDWLTDRRARRPTGEQSRAVYAHPLFHLPNFKVILQELKLTPSDYLLEVGCGGGVLLRDALQSGSRAAGVDHSPEMARLAREANWEATAERRLILQVADAHHLPFAERTFSCATMTGVFGFLADPVAALSELHRVLMDGGRIVILGSDPHWRGTPAAPEPMASRLHFYSDEELERLARAAGFSRVSVVRRSLESFAREAGVPEEAVPLFSGPGAPFLLARK